jgi:hypothetical protein
MIGASMTGRFGRGRNVVKEDRLKPIGSPSAPRILVVEDDSDIASLLVNNLRSEGYFAESAHRGDGAELRAGRRVTIDAFNSDVRPHGAQRPASTPATMSRAWSRTDLCSSAETSTKPSPRSRKIPSTASSA